MHAPIYPGVTIWSTDNREVSLPRKTLPKKPPADPGEPSIESFATELDEFLVDLKEDLMRLSRQR
ncbi:MAG: hypothetical protein J4432_03720 [DPANN group archaeon]|nr:hypothetical protein [DPANN group archaeon]